MPYSYEAAATEWLIEFNNQMQGLSADQQMDRAKELLAQLSEPPRRAYTFIYFAGVNMNELKRAEWQKSERVYAMVFGAATIVFLAVVAFLVPDPKPFQIFVFRVITSLGAGAVGAFLPGSLTAGIKRPSFAIKAGGALALAVIVYLINPPALMR